jgi:hypothetical protein
MRWNDWNPDDGRTGPFGSSGFETGATEWARSMKRHTGGYELCTTAHRVLIAQRRQGNARTGRIPGLVSWCTQEVFSGT